MLRVSECMKNLDKTHLAAFQLISMRLPMRLLFIGINVEKYFNYFESHFNIIVYQIIISTHLMRQIFFEEVIAVRTFWTRLPLRLKYANNYWMKNFDTCMFVELTMIYAKKPTTCKWQIVFQCIIEFILYLLLHSSTIMYWNSIWLSLFYCFFLQTYFLRLCDDKLISFLEANFRLKITNRKNSWFILIKKKIIEVKKNVSLPLQNRTLTNL